MNIASKEWVSSLASKIITLKESLNYDANYAICQTSASTTVKTVSLTNFKLKTGCKITVQFSYINTASAPTLNVNGTGAKGIRQYICGTYISPSIMPSICEFVYNGTYWILLTSLGDINPPAGYEICIGSYNSKPLYRKVFTTTLPTCTTIGTMSSAKTISLTGVKTFKSLAIMTYENTSTGGAWGGNNYIQGSGLKTVMAYYTYSNSSISIYQSNTSWNGLSCTIIAEYTKS